MVEVPLWVRLGIERMVHAVARNLGVDMHDVRVRVVPQLVYDVSIWNGDKTVLVSPTWIEKNSLYISAPALAILPPIEIVKAIVHELLHLEEKTTPIESLTRYLLYGSDLDEEIVEKEARRVYPKVKDIVEKARRNVIKWLATHGVTVNRVRGTEDVYVFAKKLEKIGLAKLEQLAPG